MILSMNVNGGRRAWDGNGAGTLYRYAIRSS